MRRRRDVWSHPPPVTRERVEADTPLQLARRIVVFGTQSSSARDLATMETMSTSAPPPVTHGSWPFGQGVCIADDFAKRLDRSNARPARKRPTALGGRRSDGRLVERGGAAARAVRVQRIGVLEIGTACVRPSLVSANEDKRRAAGRHRHSARWRSRVPRRPIELRWVERPREWR
jgi:hypothetical protein